MCKCSPCSDRSFFPVDRPDFRLCERFHCRIDLHIVSCSDHAHLAAVLTAVDLCPVDKVIPRGCDIHRLLKGQIQSARIDRHRHIGVHLLRLCSGKDLKVEYCDYCILCIKLCFIMCSDISERHYSAECVKAISSRLADHCHVVLRKCLDRDGRCLLDVHARYYCVISRIFDAYEDQSVQMTAVSS